MKTPAARRLLPGFKSKVEDFKKSLSEGFDMGGKNFLDKKGNAQAAEFVTDQVF